MDKSNGFKDYDYSYLRRLPIDKLLELLEIAPALSDDPKDEAYLDALEEAIIEKENKNPTGFFPDVDQQWEQFVSHYMPDMSKAMLESEPEKHAATAHTNHQPIEVPQKRVIRFSRVWRTALVAATVIVCMLAIMVTAQAAGVDVFGAMARWTEDVFSFGHIPPDSAVSECPKDEAADAFPDLTEGFPTLQAVLDAYDITEVHEPHWLPEGYAVHEVGVEHLDGTSFETYYTTYTNGDNFIELDIVHYEGVPTVQVEKTDAQVETIEQDDVVFYLIENVKSNTIAWYTEGYEYYISGKLDKSILWEIAKSMLQ